MIQTFRKIGLLEGISWILLLFVGMPLKYIADLPLPNKIIGMAHGILFISYVAFVIYLKESQNWSTKKTLILLLCAIIPLGTFWADKRYFKTGK